MKSLQIVLKEGENDVEEQVIESVSRSVQKKDSSEKQNNDKANKKILVHIFRQKVKMRRLFLVP